MFRDQHYTSLSELSDFIHLLNTLHEEEALAELQLCQTETLQWLLSEVAIPSKEYHIAALIGDILKDRKPCS